jgi:hypothetical protein
MITFMERLPAMLMWLVCFALAIGIILGGLGLPGATACGWVVSVLFWPAVTGALVTCFVALIIAPPKDRSGRKT